ncbi:hypothetical protein SJDPG11_05140 [Porphyromonas gingivalis SJD11]|nr:hypothetical protein SJDPG11_05140 [Porphyromonas gingivalis SJD11]
MSTEKIGAATKMNFDTAPIMSILPIDIYPKEVGIGS